ncbi:hypothetical protein L7F22_069079 [Adiantum nelumboides]|nr:hypothetical protein [Adiantum nelumboides]
MNEMLSTKSYEELVKLQGQVRGKLQSGEPVDVEYWEALLKSILVWRAKGKLRDMHEVVISNRLEYLKRRQKEDAARREALGLPSAEEEKAQREQERRKRLEAAASSTIEVEGSGEPDGLGMFETEAGKDLDEDEDVFNVAEDLGRRETYDWEDKFRPRKPRYFNRVHTGYEWNKYNQTHYDTDNPPPKVVQGYKFNIFYPDLIDKSKPPTYRIINERGNDETSLIVFEVALHTKRLASASSRSHGICRTDEASGQASRGASCSCIVSLSLSWVVPLVSVSHNCFLPQSVNFQRQFYRK